MSFNAFFSVICLLFEVLICTQIYFNYFKLLKVWTILNHWKGLFLQATITDILVIFLVQDLQNSLKDIFFYL
jgi:hypothetical protein